MPLKLGDYRHLASNLLAGLSLLGLLACGGLAGTPATREDRAPAASASLDEAPGYSWWHARFSSPLNDDEKPRWVSDLLVADLVVEPVIEKLGSSLALWRFHRRAVQDAGGHAFSFIFYADRQTAGQVFAMFAESPALERLIQHGLIEKYEDDLAAENQQGGPGAASDHNWSLPLQEVWPAYIMGASVMWLGLINQQIDATGAAERDFAELVGDYEKVDAALGELWRLEGQHAFLHHLSALFGYKPMQMQLELNF